MNTEELRVHIRTVADTTGAKQTEQSLKNVQTGFRASTSDVIRFAGALTGVNIGLSLFTEAGQQIRSLVASTTQAFSSQERVLRANAAAYGSNAVSFTRFAEALSATTGFSTTAILEASLSARTLSQNYGLTVEQTQKLIRVSADLASVRGIGVAEAFERVQSAIRGEAEASEFLGLTLNDTFLKNQAMNGSLRDTFEKMTDTEKAQVRYTELLRQGGQFAGLAAQGADSLEGAQRRATVASENFAKTLGGRLAPALRDVVIQQTAATDSLTRWLDQWTKVPTDQELRERAVAIEKALPIIGPAQTPRVPLGADVGARASETAAAALTRSLQQRGLAAEGPGRAIFLSQQQLARYRAEQARAGAQQRRLQEINELPRQTRAAALAEVAFLDQRDAAVRDVVNTERERLAIQAEINRLRADEANAALAVLPARQEVARLEQEITDTVDRRVQLQNEAARIAAQQRALPAQRALEDTELALQRARLVQADRSQTNEARREARQQIRELTRALPRRELAAFDATAGVRAVERREREAELAGRARQIPLELRELEARRELAGREATVAVIQQSIDRQEQLANVTAARQEQQQQALADIIQQGIQQGFINARLTMPVTVNITLPDGTVLNYQELLEAENQAGFPPVIQVSGVRRLP